MTTTERKCTFCGAIQEETAQPDYGVEVVQPQLVPSEYMRVELTMRLSEWLLIRDTLDAVNTGGGLSPLVDKLEALLTGVKGEPMLSEIAKVLKATEPCDECNSIGFRLVADEISDPEGPSHSEPCPECGGTGRRRKTVPGCVLVEDRVRLQVD